MNMTKNYLLLYLVFYKSINNERIQSYEYKKAKEDIKNTVRAYLKKNDYGQYSIPSIRQRPMLLMGPPGIGKTQIMQQIAQECNIGLVAYTITHHTRQSAVGLPFIKEKTFDGKSYSVTEYTMSEIIYSIYQYIEESGKKKVFFYRRNQLCF